MPQPFHAHPAILVAVLVAACQGPAEETPAPTPTYWAGVDLRPELDHPFFDAHALEPLSLYATCVEGVERPDAAHRGAFAVGNGSAFAILGLADPATRLHNATGPTYDRGTRFWGDWWYDLEVDGVPVTLERECVARPRGTALAVTRADGGEWTLYSVEFAPMPDDRAPPPVLGRFLLVRSRSTASHTVRLRLGSYRTLEDRDGIPVEWVAEERVLGHVPWTAETGPDGTVDLGVIDLGTVDPGGDAQAAVAALSAWTGEELDELRDDLLLVSPEAWLDQTLAWWRTWSSDGLALTSEDPRVEDLYDGLLATLRVQQGAGGGISPMSRYTGVWLRDTIGPTRFLLRAGRPDEALANLSYLYACHVDRGDYGNACDSGLDPDGVGDPPDWTTLGTLSGRTGAEGPSYVPLAWTDHARWTGDDTALDAHWDYVARGVLAQEMDPEGRQTFSGDETFRLVMGMAEGYPLEYAWQDLAWSADSSLLMRAASRRMAEAAARLGRDRAPFDDLAAAAENALEGTFRQEGGWYAPFVFHTAGSDNEAAEVAPYPFEDVNLAGLWAGAFDPEDSRALADLEALLDHAGRGDGTIQSPPDPAYAGEDMLGIEVEEGVATGMAPGYALAALTAVGHPEAEAAFNALHRYASPAGEYPEDLLYDDMSALQVLYDETGSLGDVAARYRPWEGAINLDAMLAWLAGAEPVDGGARLRPHLPNHQRSLAFDGLVVGTGRGAMQVTGDDHGRTVTFTADTAFTLWMEIPVPAGVVPDRDTDVLPAGEQVVRFDPVDLGVGETVTFEVGW